VNVVVVVGDPVGLEEIVKVEVRFRCQTLSSRVAFPHLKKSRTVHLRAHSNRAGDLECHITDWASAKAAATP
jgi:hypothetical protein